MQNRGTETSKSTENDNIASRLKALRKHHRLTQESFAESVCISRKTISEIENGKKKPSRLLLLGLENRFGADINWIITGKGNMIAGCKEKGGAPRDICDLIQDFNALSSENKKEVLALAHSLANKKEGRAE